MKILVSVLAMMIGLQANAGPSKNRTLANLGDFIILSDVEESEFTVFVSYLGNDSDGGKCGIVIRSNVRPADLLRVMTIESRDGARHIVHVNDRGINIRLANSDDMSFGDFVKFVGKTPAPLAKQIATLSDFRNAEVIVEATPCE